MSEEAYCKVSTEEGFSAEMYDCTEGYKTIGYGFNLDALEMPREVADLWLSILIADVEESLSQYSWFESTDDVRRIVLIDMCYQLGMSGLLKFKKMIAAVSVRNWSEAANQLLDSLYARQTPARALRNANILRTGKI